MTTLNKLLILALASQSSTYLAMNSSIHRQKLSAAVAQIVSQQNMEAYFTSPLISVAAEIGYIDGIRYLIECENASVSETNKFGETALHCAAARGNAEAVSLLISHGASLEPLCNVGFSPLCLAAGHGHIAIATLLLDKGAEINGTVAPYMLNVKIPVYEAAKRGHQELVTLLLERGASYSGARLMSEAIENNQSSIVRLILQRNLTIDPPIVHLASAARLGRAAIVTLLLQHKFLEQSIRTEDTISTPLHEAAGSGHLETTRLLLEAGASP